MQFDFQILPQRGLTQGEDDCRTGLANLFIGLFAALKITAAQFSDEPTDYQLARLVCDPAAQVVCDARRSGRDTASQQNLVGRRICRHSHRPSTAQSTDHHKPSEPQRSLQTNADNQGAPAQNLWAGQGQ